MTVSAIIAGLIAAVLGFLAVKQRQINNLENENEKLKVDEVKDEAHSLSDDELSRRIKSDLSKSD